jgi:hypothetical protein
LEALEGQIGNIARAVPSMKRLLPHEHEHDQNESNDNSPWLLFIGDFFLLTKLSISYCKSEQLKAVILPRGDFSLEQRGVVVIGVVRRKNTNEDLTAILCV